MWFRHRFDYEAFEADIVRFERYYSKYSEGMEACGPDQDYPRSADARSELSEDESVSSDEDHGVIYDDERESVSIHDPYHAEVLYNDDPDDSDDGYSTDSFVSSDVDSVLAGDISGANGLDRVDEFQQSASSSTHSLRGLVEPVAGAGKSVHEVRDCVLYGQQFDEFAGAIQDGISPGCSDSDSDASSILSDGLDEVDHRVDYVYGPDGVDGFSVIDDPTRVQLSFIIANHAVGGWFYEEACLQRYANDPVFRSDEVTLIEVPCRHNWRSKSFRLQHVSCSRGYDVANPDLSVFVYNDSYSRLKRFTGLRYVSPLLAHFMCAPYVDDSAPSGTLLLRSWNLVIGPTTVGRRNDDVPNRFPFKFRDAVLHDIVVVLFREDGELRHEVSVCVDSVNDDRFSVFISDAVNAVNSIVISLSDLAIVGFLRSGRTCLRMLLRPRCVADVVFMSIDDGYFVPSTHK
jgi:hypothetical protein